MDIVIAGDGEVGLHLAEALVRDNHNITIVDPHEELLKMVAIQPSHPLSSPSPPTFSLSQHQGLFQ